ncbi:MAG: RagB/SusD family nutrient uptake outer membrane protein [Bacteroidales bacterium]|nr:RagB/SusD family nutrient uptake outer membrane protein [Bacteroidales bacterium]
MKRQLTIICLVASVFAGVSCNSLLDLTPRDRVSDIVMWNDVQSAEYAVNDIVSYTYNIFASWPSSVGMTEAFTDEFKYGSYVNFAYALIPSQVAYGGTNLTNNFVDVYLGCWGSLYSAVRRTNEALDNLHTLGTKLSAADVQRLEGELLLMRGWLYFELVKRYKEVILYDEDLTAIKADKALSTEAQGWDFIEKDLKDAAAKLPVKAAASGRLDKGVAFAVTSRAMLYAGRNQAVVDAVDSLAALGYSLEPAYADAFTKSVSAGNRETIFQYSWSYSDNITHEFDFYYSPGGDYALAEQIGGGYGTPTQEMVESYEYATGGKPDWSAWHGTTTTDPPYALLEPRFQATILYNGAAWKGRTIEPYVGGIDGFCTWNREPQPNGRTTTGYYLRKMVDETHNIAERAQSTQHFVVLRYGEALLNKAEACYRLGYEDKANAAVKAIRDRVGLPYTDKTGDALWTAIRQERRIELAYEGLWYWDLRRWGDADKAYPQGLNGYQVHGLKIEKDTGTGVFTYKYVSVDDQDRNFPAKMYRFPLPESEINSNSLVSQYPEWN